MINWQHELVERQPQGALHRALHFLSQSPVGPEWLEAAERAQHIARELLGGETLVASIAGWLPRQHSGVVLIDNPSPRMEWAATKKEELMMLHSQSTFSQIKTIVLRTLDDLVTHCIATGEYSDALSAILKSPDAANRMMCNPQSLCIASKLAILNGNDSAIAMVLNSSLSREISNGDMTSIVLILGLKNIREGNFRAAAREFLRLPKLSSGAAMPDDFSMIMTSSDLALAGMVCVLTSGEREMMHAALSGDSILADNIRCSPDCRPILDAVLSFRPAHALRLLQPILRRLRVFDPHLGPQASLLMAQIRIALVENFCRPFSAIPIPRLLEHFEDQLTRRELMDSLTCDVLPDVKIDEKCDVLRRCPRRPTVHPFVISVAAECLALNRRLEAIEDARRSTA